MLRVLRNVVYVRLVTILVLVTSTAVAEEDVAAGAAYPAATDGDPTIRSTTVREPSPTEEQLVAARPLCHVLLLYFIQQQQSH